MDVKDYYTNDNKYNSLLPDLKNFIKDVQQIADYIEYNFDLDPETTSSITALQKAMTIFYGLDKNDTTDNKDNTSDNTSDNTTDNTSYNTSSDDIYSSDENSKKSKVNIELVDYICDTCKSKYTCHSCCGSCELRLLRYMNRELDSDEVESYEEQLSIQN